MPSVFMIVPVRGDQSDSVRVEFEPSFSVDVLDEEYRFATDFDDSTVVKQLEPTFIRGGIVDCDGEKTFEQAGLKDGDTLHLLLPHANDLPIKIHNVCSNQTLTLATTSDTSLEVLKWQLYESHPHFSCARWLNYEQLVFKYDGEYLEDGELTLGEYNVQSDDTLFLDVVHYDITVVVPTFGKTMERIVCRPNDTISTIRDAVAKVERAKYSPLNEGRIPVLLWSAIPNKSGILVHLLLDIYAREMSVFMDESTENSSQPIYRCVVENGHTVEDIYRMVEKEAGYKLTCMDPTEEKWPKKRIFDYTWTRTFAPQIDVDPVAMSADRALPVYFFPYRTHLRAMCVSSLCTVHCFINAICEKENTPGVERNLRKLGMGIHLVGSRILYDYEECVTVQPSLILEKRVTPIHYSRCMKVYVRWPTRVTSPTEFIVEPDNTIASLKDQIESELKVPMSMQKLIFSGTPIQDDSARISDVGIQEGSIVELLPKLEENSVTKFHNGTKKGSTVEPLVHMKGG